MRKARWLIVTLITVGILGVIQVGAAQALSFNAGSNVSVSDEQIDSTVFAAGQTVDINSDVDGDVFCGGQTVNINGNVTGDIICAGQILNINGDVDGDVRVAGQTVTVNGIIGGSLTAGGQTFNLNTDSRVGRDASIGSTTANINGSIGRDLLAGGANIVLSGSVDRDIVAGVDELLFEDSAEVGGDVDYTSSNEATVEDGALIAGDLIRTEPSGRDNQPSELEVFGIGFGFMVYVFVSLLLIAMVIALAAPSVLHRTSEQAIRRPWGVLLTGFLATVTVPVALFLLMITVIGIPLGIILGLAWVLIVSLSGVFSGYYIGRLILREQTNPMLIMLAGGSLLLVLYLIPFIGILAIFAAVWFGVGMILLEQYDRMNKPVYDTNKLSKKK